jgi:hypothetical protein
MIETTDDPACDNPKNLSKLKKILLSRNVERFLKKDVAQNVFFSAWNNIFLNE